MATILNQVALTATDSSLLLVSRAQGGGPAGRRLTISLGPSGAWSGSAVLKIDTGAPGQAVSLTNVAYINASTGASVSAGTAITTADGFIVADTYNNYDLYFAYTHTSGDAQVVITTEDGGAGDLTDIGDATANSLVVTRSATVGTTLGVTGATTLSSTLAVTGTATLTAAPVLSALTASQAVFTNGSKVATSNAITGTGNVVMSASPTLTGTIGAASQTLSGTLGVTGATTATGGLILASQPTIQHAAGGMWVLATAGTDTACTNGTSYFVELNIPYNRTCTGLAYQVGSVGGTDKVIVVLYNSAGTVVANSDTAGATVGTAAQIQSVDFLTPYAAVSGRYFASVTFNGATAKFRTYPIPGSKFIAGSEAETFGTVTDITPGTSFTADKGPLCYVY